MGMTRDSEAALQKLSHAAILAAYDLLAILPDPGRKIWVHDRCADAQMMAWRRADAIIGDRWYGFNGDDMVDWIREVECWKGACI